MFCTHLCCTDREFFFSFVLLYCRTKWLFSCLCSFSLFFFLLLLNKRLDSTQITTNYLQWFVWKINDFLIGLNVREKNHLIAYHERDRRRKRSVERERDGEEKKEHWKSFIYASKRPLSQVDCTIYSSKHRIDWFSIVLLNSFLIIAYSFLSFSYTSIFPLRVTKWCSSRPIIVAINVVKACRVYSITGQMATFSSTPPAAASNTLSTTSSLSYHHLLSTSNGSNNNNHNSTNSTSSEENLTQTNPIHDININHTFDGNTSYLNNPDFSLCLTANQQTNPFDVVVSQATSPSHFNNDPLVRHFFNYRQNDGNLPGNYYANMSTGAFVNAFDYSYTNLTPTGLTSDTTISNHPFSTSNSVHSHPQFVNGYPAYSHPQQQLLKPVETFSIPPSQQVQQQQQQQQAQQQHLPQQSITHTSQQQNIYPWMRRIHSTCGEFLRSSSFIFFLLPFFVYILASIFFTIHAQSFLWAIYVVLLFVRGDLWARSVRDEWINEFVYINDVRLAIWLGQKIRVGEKEKEYKMMPTESIVKSFEQMFLMVM